jgi:hypothetical protein
MQKSFGRFDPLHCLQLRLRLRRLGRLLQQQLGKFDFE